MSATTDADAGHEPYRLACAMFPRNRSLAGPGFRAALEQLEEASGPMDRHTFATGEQVFDWTVPDEWDLRDAWIAEPGGRHVVTLAQSNLHVVGYSAPVHRRIGLDELQGHLHSLPDRPDAIPYRTSYYKRDWGFCLSDRQRRSLQPGEYEVHIDAELAPGRLELGEVVIPGRQRDEVLFSTYCCHPSLANNELSGPVVTAHLARWLRARGTTPRLTYRFLFIPETIGSIAYLHRFGERLRERLVAGFVVTCVGDDGPYTYKRSRRGDSLADRVAEHVLLHADPSPGHEVLDFFPTGGDERQYCSPGFDLPVGSLTRAMYGTYAEYHTSDDDLSFISEAGLGGSLRTYQRIVEGLEAARTMRVTMPFCEPQLGRRGLYPTTGGTAAVAQRIKDTMALLNYCDGSADLLAVADRAGRPIGELAMLADLLCDHDLLNAT